MPRVLEMPNEDCLSDIQDAELLLALAATRQSAPDSEGVKMLERELARRVAVLKEGEGQTPRADSGQQLQSLMLDIKRLQLRVKELEARVRTLSAFG